MALNFPNPVRLFDAGRSCVSFWGSDAALEIAFQIDFDALQKLSQGLDGSEAAALVVFDQNRGAILKAATSAYSKHKTSYHRLTAASF